MKSLLASVGAAFLEIGGCFAVLVLAAARGVGLVAAARGGGPGAFAWLLTRSRSMPPAGLCRLWRRLHRRNTGLALAGRRHTAGSLGSHRSAGLPGGRRHHPVRAAPSRAESRTSAGAANAFVVRCRMRRQSAVWTCCSPPATASSSPRPCSSQRGRTARARAAEQRRPDPAAVLRRLRRHLADRGFAVLTYDYRGLGELGQAAPAATMEQWGAIDQASMIDHLARARVPAPIVP